MEREISYSNMKPMPTPVISSGPEQHLCSDVLSNNINERHNAPMRKCKSVCEFYSIHHAKVLPCEPHLVGDAALST